MSSLKHHSKWHSAHPALLVVALLRLMDTRLKTSLPSTLPKTNPRLSAFCRSVALIGCPQVLSGAAANLRPMLSSRQRPG